MNNSFWLALKLLVLMITLLWGVILLGLIEERMESLLLRSWIGFLLTTIGWIFFPNALFNSCLQGFQTIHWFLSPLGKNRIMALSLLNSLIIELNTKISFLGLRKPGLLKLLVLLCSCCIVNWKLSKLNWKELIRIYVDVFLKRFC